MARKLQQNWTIAGFRPDGGTAWIADIPSELWHETDTNELPYRSRLRLLEDGRELGPAHALHSSIQDMGEGRYSFWSGVVYFSASDGSDPNVNGRVYSIIREPLKSDAMAVLRAIAPARYGSTWSAPKRPLKCAVLGLGNRGASLARLLVRLEGVEVSWLVDTSTARIDDVRRDLGGDAVRATSAFSDAFADPDVDAVLITLPDHLHREAAEQAFAAGKNVYLEKPIATNVDDAKAILRAWKKSRRVFQIGYVLRAVPFYQAIRNVVRQERLGPIRQVHLSEQLSVAHGASYMRRWHGDGNSGGLIVHKSCHDLDLVCWLLDTRPRQVSSFGGLEIFRKPPPAPFCSQCEVRADCPYVDTGLFEHRTAAEQANPTAFGLDRCVFSTDRDIVDDQVVSFELESGARGTYYLAMQGPQRSERRIALIGDNARLDGNLLDGRFTIKYVDPAREPLEWSWDRRRQGGHGGGDRSTLIGFLNACAERGPAPIKRVSNALSGLVFAVAAERARKTNSVVSLGDDNFKLE